MPTTAVMAKTGRRARQHAAELAPGMHEQRIDEAENDDAGDDLGEADRDAVRRGAGGQHHRLRENDAMEAGEQREAHGERVDEERETGERLPDGLVRRRGVVAHARVCEGQRREQRDPDGREPVQSAGEDARDHGGRERGDPDGAMHPQAEDGGEQQDEWQVGRCRHDRIEVRPLLLGNGECPHCHLRLPGT